MNIISLIGPLIGIVGSLAGIVYCIRAIIKQQWRIPANREIITGPRAILAAVVRLILASAFLVVSLVGLGCMCSVLAKYPLVPIEWLYASVKVAILIFLGTMLVGWVGDRKLSQSRGSDEHME